MYIYWRVQQELNEMGNDLSFSHPGMIRELKRWIRKNAEGLALAHNLTREDLMKIPINRN